MFAAFRHAIIVFEQFFPQLSIEELNIAVLPGTCPESSA